MTSEKKSILSSMKQWLSGDTVGVWARSWLTRIQRENKVGARVKNRSTRFGRLRGYGLILLMRSTFS